jgi:hypothetical protein
MIQQSKYIKVPADAHERPHADAHACMWWRVYSKAVQQCHAWRLLHYHSWLKTKGKFREIVRTCGQSHAVVACLDGCCHISNGLQARGALPARQVNKEIRR